VLFVGRTIGAQLFLKKTSPILLSTHDMCAYLNSEIFTVAHMSCINSTCKANLFGFEHELFGFEHESFGEVLTLLSKKS